MYLMRRPIPLILKLVNQACEGFLPEREEERLVRVAFQGVPFRGRALKVPRAAGAQGVLIKRSVPPIEDAISPITVAPTIPANAPYEAYEGPA